MPWLAVVNVVFSLSRKATFADGYGSLTSATLRARNYELLSNDDRIIYKDGLANIASTRWIRWSFDTQNVKPKEENMRLSPSLYFLAQFSYFSPTSAAMSNDDLLENTAAWC